MLRIFFKGDIFGNELEVYKIIETFRFCIGLIGNILKLIYDLQLLELDKATLQYI